MPTSIYKTKDGVRVPGVTTVIGSNLGWNKGALMYWAWNEGIEGRNFRDTSQQAADIGTIAHEMVRCEIIKTRFDSSKYPPELVEKAETPYLAFLEWADLVSFTPIETEIPLVSEEHGFGGTPDIAAVKKVTAIVDLKTSKGVYPDHKIQIAAYGRLWNENFPDDPIQGYYLLQLGKEDASFAYYYWPSMEKSWKAFEHLLALHKLQKELKSQA